MLNFRVHLKEDIDENTSTVESFIRKIKPKNSDILLSIIVLGNQDYLTKNNKKYSSKSINFWKKALSLENWKILRGYKPETIKKYWAIIRESNLEAIINYIVYNRDNIDNDKLPLLTLISKIIEDSKLFVLSLEIINMQKKIESQREDHNLILDTNIIDDDTESVVSDKSLLFD